MLGNAGLNVLTSVDIPTPSIRWIFKRCKQRIEKEILLNYKAVFEFYSNFFYNKHYFSKFDGFLEF